MYAFCRKRSVLNCIITYYKGKIVYHDISIDCVGIFLGILILGYFISCISSFNSENYVLQLECYLRESTRNHQAISPAHSSWSKFLHSNLLLYLVIFSYNEVHGPNWLYRYTWQEMVEFLVDIWELEGLVWLAGKAFHPRF